MTETARLGLPMLSAGQAQKEITVNEALARIDLCAQLSVAAVGLNSVPPGPIEGQAWVVGDAPVGDWAGQAHAVAGWTAGGWRFVTARDGMQAWSEADGCFAVHADGQWRVGVLTGRRVEIGGLPVLGARAAAIASPSGGTVVDAEARGTLHAVLAALRNHGLIAT